MSAARVPFLIAVVFVVAAALSSCGGRTTVALPTAPSRATLAATIGRGADGRDTIAGNLGAEWMVFALQNDVARGLSPQRAFVRAMILAATVVAGALLAAFELVSPR